MEPDTPRLNLIADLPTALTFEISDGSVYRADTAREVYVNGELALTTDLNVFTLGGLKPDTLYKISLGHEDIVARTLTCKAVLDPRAFGAKGDGVSDDTHALQAAISACPCDGRVRLSAGDYVSGPLFIKSDIAFEIAKGAHLLGRRETDNWPILPGTLYDDDGHEKTWLGSWEGEALACHAALINIIAARNVMIYGEGEIDGRAGFDTWWSRTKTPFGEGDHAAWRPRLISIIDSEKITLEGLTFANSPSWTIHPLNSRWLTFTNLQIKAPSDSPNTDGLNPESCTDVKISGIHFTVGDDCIALKSGKISMARKALRPTRRVSISNCWMQNGHGAIVIGSEMACGVYDVKVQNCLFTGTDRGLRIKTRRGRGKDAVASNIRFDNIRMKNVGTAFVINSFYWCDPDGKTDYVGNRNPFPIDDRTPSIGDITLTRIYCDQTRHAAAYLLGLPEQPIDGIHIDDFRVSFSETADAGFPDMAASIPAVARKGLYICNARNVSLNNLSLKGYLGQEIELENVL
ncbi:glycoside hydrolase family 28 protein [Asticcacaulis sp. ZE23SCel15]|uniref:glycoside hydrolase family 28 protein n=1 Tax=Asticcacaulis sp. ZE23SCel15 TaxID=3059027 RepID=UPI00265F7D6A|nr:glycoside hydrolase family 28 protein [Asticcacaulis sp. ZE23SCel15]WKL58082.1 glycoside hydrolase family 28 protein [Asticcacaulis sp. ZE23SCel15]